jgi:hypothetical protein
MRIRQLLIEFGSSFFLVLVVTSLVTYLWNMLFHSTAVVDWETSFQLAIILGIVLTWVKAGEKAT